MEGQIIASVILNLYTDDTIFDGKLFFKARTNKMVSHNQELKVLYIFRDN